jgi:hypothetical protein
MPRLDMDQSVMAVTKLARKNPMFGRGAIT